MYIYNDFAILRIFKKILANYFWMCYNICVKKYTRHIGLFWAGNGHHFRPPPVESLSLDSISQTTKI